MKLKVGIFYVIEIKTWTMKSVWVAQIASNPTQTRLVFGEMAINPCQSLAYLKVSLFPFFLLYPESVVWQASGRKAIQSHYYSVIIAQQRILKSFVNFFSHFPLITYFVSFIRLLCTLYIPTVSFVYFPRFRRFPFINFNLFTQKLSFIIVVPLLRNWRINPGIEVRKRGFSSGLAVAVIIHLNDFNKGTTIQRRQLAFARPLSIVLSICV